MQKPSPEMWIQSLSESLTSEQKDKIRDEAKDQVFENCLQDRSYMLSIVNGWLDSLPGLLEVSCEIAGGDRDMTKEILGFDVVTGKEAS